MDIILHARGTTAENDSYTGPASQFTVDTERWEIRLHDGETPGGHRILNLAQLMLLFMSLDSEFGDVEFDPAAKGFLVRTGDRQYALRGVTAGTGISVENPLGTAGDAIISLGDITGTIIASIAGRLPYAVTGGSAAAFTADFPTGWPNGAGVDGPVGIIKFHVAPADGATLSVDGATAYPLRTADGLNDINRVAGIDDVAMFVRADDAYYLIGLTTPLSMGLTPIAGLTATNVQDAIEELLEAIEALTGGGSISVPRLSFASVTTVDGTSANVPIAEDQYVWISGRSLETLSVDCAMTVNAVEVANPPADKGFMYRGLYYRKNNKLYVGRELADLDAPLSNPFIPPPGVAYVDTDLEFHSNFAGTEVVVQITGFTSLPRIVYSVPGAPFSF